jgi:nitrile hydratase subunit alpha
MTQQQTMSSEPALVLRRAEALETALTARGFATPEAIEEFNHRAEEEWVTRNGARVVARAWTDEAFR